MPKPTKGPRLGGSSSHQKAMLANLATSLFEHGRIKTTEPKARALRPYAEKLITHAKKGTLHNRREVMKKIRDKDVVHALFAEIGPFFADRNGGYTRIIKVEARKGDNAPMAVIELVREKTVTAEATRVANRAVGGGEEGRSGRGARRRGLDRGADRRRRGCRRAARAAGPTRRRGLDRGADRAGSEDRSQAEASRPRTPASPTPRPPTRLGRGASRGRGLTSPEPMSRSPPSIPVTGTFGFGSISPTTEPSSPAGRHRPVTAPWPACSTRRCRRCSAYRCGCSRGRTHRHRRARHRSGRPRRCAGRLRCAHAYPRTTRAGDPEFRPLVRRLARFLPAGCPGASTSAVHQRDSTRGSRRLRRHYAYHCRWRRTVSSRNSRAT